MSVMWSGLESNTPSAFLPRKGSEECDRRCLEAEGDRCNCRCGGHNHGLLTKIRNNMTLDGMYEIDLTSIESVAEIFRGKTCVICREPLDNANIYGYPHDGGIYVENFDMTLWVYARCQKCGYDNAWWKVERLEKGRKGSERVGESSSEKNSERVGEGLRGSEKYEKSEN